MKFGKKIRNECVAAWTQFYFDYKAAKVFLKPFKVLVKQAKADGTELPDRFKWSDSDEKEWDHMLERESIKIETFFVSQMDRVRHRLEKLKTEVGQGLDVKQRATELYELAFNLRSFCVLNREAFGKIMKKHDKISGRLMRAEVLERCDGMKMWHGAEQLEPVLDFVRTYMDDEARSDVGARLAKLSELYVSVAKAPTYAMHPLDLQTLPDVQVQQLRELSVSDLQGVDVAKLEHLEHLGKITAASKQQAQAQRPFRVLMIIAAAAVAFAHGSNDVANAIGPFAAMYEYQVDGRVDKDKKNLEMWILVMGGVGIVCGLWFLGAKVIETIGTKIATMTFSGGFCAQIGAAITVMVATYLGLPVSTTTTLVGAIAGVGLVDAFDSSNQQVTKSLDGKVLAKIVASWFLSVGAAAVTTIAIYYLLVAIRG